MARQQVDPSGFGPGVREEQLLRHSE